MFVDEAERFFELRDDAFEDLGEVRVDLGGFGFGG